MKTHPNFDTPRQDFYVSAEGHIISTLRARSVARLKDRKSNGRWVGTFICEELRARPGNLNAILERWEFHLEDLQLDPPEKQEGLLDVAKGAWQGASNPRALLRSLGLALDRQPGSLSLEDCQDIWTVLDHVRSLLPAPDPDFNLKARYEGGAP